MPVLKKDALLLRLCFLEKNLKSIPIKVVLITGKVYCDITFLTEFILTHPVNFLCGRKPEHPEKTHNFRQSVD
jgi:hypothetical protein